MADEPAPQASSSREQPQIDGLDVGRSDERQLVADILRRDRKAMASFVTGHTDALYGYLRHRLAPRADVVDDMVQDVFVAALEGLSQFRGSSTLRSWLMGIARHKVEDFYRRQLRAAESLDDDDSAEPASEAPLADEIIDRERAQEKALAVLQRLPEQYSFVLLWRYWENRSIREIADATGRTDKAIERTLARARARFRAIWERG